MDQNPNILVLNESVLLAAKRDCFFPLPSSVYVNVDTQISLDEYFTKEKKYSEHDPNTNPKEQIVVLNTTQGSIVYCPGYMLVVQEVATERYYLAFLPETLLPHPDTDNVFFKLEQFCEHFDLQQSEQFLTVPRVKLPRFEGVLLKIEGKTLCRADFEPVPDRLLQMAPSLSATSASKLHLQLVLHSSDPIRMFPGLIMFNLSCTVDVWFPRLLDVIMLVAKPNSPGDSIWHIKPKYEIELNSDSSSGEKKGPWSLFMKFAQVTQSTKSTFAQILSHPLSKPFVPYLPPAFVDFVGVPSEHIAQEYPESAGQYLRQIISMSLHGLEQGSGKGPRDSDSGAGTDNDWEMVHIVPNSKPLESHRRRHPISAEEWLANQAENGALLDSSPAAIAELKADVFFSGLETDLRPYAWKFLLGMYPWNSTEAERAVIDKQAHECYDSLVRLWNDVIFGEGTSTHELLAAKENDLCGSSESFGNAGDEHSGLSNIEKVKERYHRIVKDVVRTDRTIPFFKKKQEPPVAAPEQLAKSPELEPLGIEGLDFESQADVDKHLESLKHVLMSYTMLEFDLGYVQGMNDLCAPFMVVMRDEADAFWCYAQWMKQCKQNFSKTQLPMHQQLLLLARLVHFTDPDLHHHFVKTGADNYFFSFRWILVRFKREFEFNEIGRLWEILWTRHLSPCFFFFVALAILELHRPKLLELDEFEDALKYMNDLSTRLPLEQLLSKAEVLFYEFEYKIKSLLRSEPALEASTVQPTEPPPLPLCNFISAPEFYTSTPDEVFDQVQPGWRGLLALIYT